MEKFDSLDEDSVQCQVIVDVSHFAQLAYKSSVYWKPASISLMQGLMLAGCV